MAYEVEVRVLGGLPLIAHYEWVEADWSVGLSAGPDNVQLLDRKGRPARWAEDKLDDDAWDALTEQISEKHYENV